MDLDFTPEEQAFRTNVRGFLEAKVPSGTRSKILASARASNEEVVRWHRILHEHGWGAPNWPKDPDDARRKAAITRLRRFLRLEDQQRS